MLHRSLEIQWYANCEEPPQEHEPWQSKTRGAFVADGTEGWITDHTYVSREDVPERIWAQLVTWKQPISEDQGEAIQETVDDFGTREEISAAGDARTGPRSP